MAPAPLAAQTGLPPAGAVSGVTGTADVPWRLQLTASGTWYENAYFALGQPTESWSTTGLVSLSRSSGFRRGSLSFAGYGGVIYYPDIDSLNQPTYGGRLGLVWEPGRRTQVRVTQAYDRSNTRLFPELDAEGLPLPSSEFEVATAGLGLTQGLSRRWLLDVGVGYAWRQYDDDRLVGGEQLVGIVQVARQLGKSTSAYLSYGYGSAWFESEERRVHQALVGVQRRPPRGVGYEIAGGAGYLESTGKVYPSGVAGIRAAGRRTSLAVRYSRTFGQAFGYGRETIADVVSATAGWTPHRKLTLSAGYTFGYRRDPTETSDDIRSHVASAGFAWTIAKDLGFDARYSWETNDTEGFSTVEGGRVMASLSYGVGWR
jgi:hypothetical protein